MSGIVWVIYGSPAGAFTACGSGLLGGLLIRRYLKLRFGTHADARKAIEEYEKKDTGGSSL